MQGRHLSEFQDAQQLEKKIDNDYFLPCLYKVIFQEEEQQVQIAKMLKYCQYFVS